MSEVARAGPDDWREARSVRLRALTDAPGAFASTHAREAAFDEAIWRERLVGSAWFLARRDRRPVGIAVGIAEPDVPDARMLVAMWVAPERRGDGTAVALVDAVVGWAREDGARLLTLWVVDDNERARRFYARLGFRPDGSRQPMPNRSSIEESRLRRRV